MTASNNTPLISQNGAAIQLKITLRPATAKDAPQISAFGTHTWAPTFGYSVPAEDLQAYLDKAYGLEGMTKDILNPNIDTIVATTPDPHTANGKDGHNDTTLGFAMLTRNSTEPCVAHLPQTVELQRLYVHVNYHRHGIGTLLAREVERIARLQGFKHIWLGVWEENTKALSVYRRLGYKRVGEHDFVTGSIVQTDDIMAKEL